MAWAEQCGLQGVVCDAGELKSSPAAAVALLRSKGLQLATYGRQNNEPAFVQQQQEAGMAMVILDYCATARAAAAAAAASS